MERRSWRWKKVFDRIVSPPITSDSSPSEDTIKQSEEVSVSGCPYQGSEIIHAPREQLDALDANSQQTDAKLRILAEQLMARDELVHEHANVAEEAVLGWENAEHEAACLRWQLDEIMLQRATMADQLVGLDVALKDCLGKLKHSEDREWKLKDVLMAKEQELERVHREMESIKSKLVNEMTRTAKEADAKVRAEEKASLLQTKVDMAEEELSKWKKEVRVLTKELSMRTEEEELGKKEAEAASKQHLESVKRVVILEERLRLLLGKKFLGPTVAQIRTKAGATPVIFDRSSCSMFTPLNQYANHDKESTECDAVDQFACRLLAAEEEVKSLRDSLSKKDGELQSARMLCAKMVMKLSAAQEQIERSSYPPRPHHRSTKSAIDWYTPYIEEALPCDQSVRNESESADSWASALITELAQISKEKEGLDARPSLLMPSTDLIDDFAEMEKLASVSLENHGRTLGYLGKVEAFGHDKDIKEMLIANEYKLSSVENELYAVKLENSALKDALLTVEKHLVAFIRTETSDRIPYNRFEEVRTALDSVYKRLAGCTVSSYASFHGVESPEVRDTSAWSSPGGRSSCLSEEVAIWEPDTPMESHIVAKLCAAIHKVVGLSRELAQADLASDTSDTLASPSPGKAWRGLEFEACVQSLVELCNGVLDDKVEVHDFLEEIASALEWLVGHMYALWDTSSSETRRRLEFGKSSINTSEPCGVLSSKDAASYVMLGSLACQVEVPLEEIVCVGSHHEEINASIGQQLTQLRSEKKEIDLKLSLMTRELELMKSLSLLHHPEQSAMELRQGPASAPESRPTTDNGEVVSKMITSRMRAARVVGATDQSQTGVLAVTALDLAHWSETMSMSRSSPNSETRPTMINPVENPWSSFCMTRNEGVIECLPKVNSCLSKELPENVSGPLPNSDQNFMEPYEAHHETQKSLEQLQSLKGVIRLHQESQRREYAKAPPAHQKGPPFDGAVCRELAMVPSHKRFLKSRINLRGELPGEKHTTGISRFFFKPSFH